MVNIAQTGIIGTLLVALLEDDTPARFIVFASALIIAFGVTMLIVFLPKVFAVVFPPKNEQVKITLEGSKLVPTILKGHIRHQHFTPSPMLRYLSRSLFPSKAVQNILAEQVVPENFGHDQLSKIEESKEGWEGYAKSSTPIIFKLHEGSCAEMHIAEGRCNESFNGKDHSVRYDG